MKAPKDIFIDVLLLGLGLSNLYFNNQWQNIVFFNGLLNLNQILGILGIAYAIFNLSGLKKKIPDAI